MNVHDPRTAVLAERLTTVRHRIAQAALGRSAPTLIVVSKFHPGADVLRLRSLGVFDFGENRDQEASGKAREVGIAELRWHFIGQLQGNKAKSVAAYAHSVHSVDRASLVSSLGKAMAMRQQETGRNALECFVQVDLSSAYPELPAATPGSRGGATPDQVENLAERIAQMAGLRLAGVMAVAPLGVAPEPAFELLAEVSAAMVRQHPQATAISAGMSHDLEAAIAWGATHLRVGSDILGPRPAVL